MHKGKYECSLSIQTQDSFPASVNDTVKCVVVSSLVTTQRKLKAMSLLNSRNQLARAILNPNPMDFCTKDLLTTSSERIVSDCDHRESLLSGGKGPCRGCLLPVPMSAADTHFMHRRRFSAQRSLVVQSV